MIAMSGYAFANADRAPDFLRMTIELGAACLPAQALHAGGAVDRGQSSVITKPAASARHSK